MHQLVQEQTGIDFSFQTLEDAKAAAHKAGIEGLKGIDWESPQRSFQKV